VSETVTEMVTRLWRAVPEQFRWEFDRHPVDEVRNLEAEVERLRNELEAYRNKPKLGKADGGWSWSSIHAEEHGDGCSRDDCLVMDIAAVGLEQEAENERLRARIAAESKYTMDEIRRLRAALAAETKDKFKRIDERERLQESLDGNVKARDEATEKWDKWWRRAKEAEAEVERLRADVQAAWDRGYDEGRLEQHDEVERLRAALELKGKATREAQDAVGRYKAEVERLGNSLIESEKDNERLRAERDAARTEENGLEIQVERLRGIEQENEARLRLEVEEALAEVEKLREAALRHTQKCHDPDAQYLERAALAEEKE